MYYFLYLFIVYSIFRGYYSQEKFLSDQIKRASISCGLDLNELFQPFPTDEYCRLESGGLDKYSPYILSSLVCNSVYDALMRQCNPKGTDHSTTKDILISLNDKYKSGDGFCKDVVNLSTKLKTAAENGKVDALRFLNSTERCKKACYDIDDHFIPLCLFMLWRNSNHNETVTRREMPIGVKESIAEPKGEKSNYPISSKKAGEVRKIDKVENDAQLEELRDIPKLGGHSKLIPIKDSFGKSVKQPDPPNADLFKLPVKSGAGTADIDKDPALAVMQVNKVQDTNNLPADEEEMVKEEEEEAKEHNNAENVNEKLNVPNIEKNEEKIDNDNKNDENMDERERDSIADKNAGENERTAGIDKLPSERGSETYIMHRRFSENADSHFFTYFTVLSFVFIVFYCLVYQKKKILALMFEGRRTRSKRRPNTAAYSKLDTNLEEAMLSGPSSTQPTVFNY